MLGQPYVALADRAGSRARSRAAPQPLRQSLINSSFHPPRTTYRIPTARNVLPSGGLAPRSNSCCSARLVRTGSGSQESGNPVGRAGNSAAPEQRPTGSRAFSLTLILCLCTTDH